MFFLNLFFFQNFYQLSTVKKTNGQIVLYSFDKNGNIIRRRVITPSYSTINATSCVSYNLNSETYQTSGTYLQKLKNVGGADSTITLNLTILQPTKSMISATAYGSYTLNTQTYTSSGIYIQTLTNKAGCDSILTLKLTIKNLDTWEGYGNWIDTNNWSSHSIPLAGTDITVQSGELIINQNVDVFNVTIKPGAKLTLNTGKTLLVKGNFTIESNASGTGSFVDQDGIVTVNGTTLVQQFVKGGRNWYLSSPLSNVQSSVVKSNVSNKLWQYNELTTSWDELVSQNLSLTPITGYVASINIDDTLLFTGGTLNTGLQTISLNRSGTSNEKRGFNLIGNPFPSSVNWNMATKINMESSIWYRTKNISNTYVFDTYNTLSKIGTNNNKNGAVSEYIPAMQSVWVRVKTDGLLGQLIFNNTMRSHQTTKVLKADDSENETIHLQVSNGVNSDETVVMFNENAENGFDDFDSPKMFVNNIDVPELYTLAGNEKLVINGLKSMDYTKTIPLGFKTAKAGLFTVSVSEISGFDGIPVILEDKQLNKTQDLIENSNYSFNSDSVNNANRFKLHFKSNNEQTGSKIEQSEIRIYSLGHNAIIKTSDDLNTGFIEVYNLLGQNITNETLKGNTTIVELPSTTQTYFIKVTTQKKVQTQKIIIE